MYIIREFHITLQKKLLKKNNLSNLSDEELRLAQKESEKFHYAGGFLSNLHPQQWKGLVASIIFIILLSIFFFLNGKNPFSKETNFLESRTDSIIISKYAKDSPTAANQITDTSSVLSSIINIKKVEKPDNPAYLPEQRRKNDEENQRIDANEPFEYTTEPGDVDERENRAVYDPNQVRPVSGDKAFKDYIENNQWQLSDANCRNQQGKVILLFKVNAHGRPFDIAVLRSLCPAADKEAVRLLQNSPDWTVSDYINRLEIIFSGNEENQLPD